MAEHPYVVNAAQPIALSDCTVDVDQLLRAIHQTNACARTIVKEAASLEVSILEVMDLRLLSGVLGQIFAAELAKVSGTLLLNPSIDGYPDLCQVATEEMRAYFDDCATADLLKYRHGGLEVKNTFGNKRYPGILPVAEQRVTVTQKRLVWKAHHQTTNHLVGLMTDFISGEPVIVGLWYSDRLETADWSERNNPRPGSAMSSFTELLPSGWEKMRRGLKLTYDDRLYRDFTA